MKREKRKQRLTLTLLVTVFVFCIIFISLIIAIILTYFMLWAGILTSIDGHLEVSRVLVFMSVISMIVGFLVTGFIGKISLKPINRFIDKMNCLASGDFKVRISFGKPIDNYPAFVEVAESFNKMAEELENTEVLRRDFINNFSHEFKTPIASIAGFARLLKKENLTEEQRREYLEVIEEEACRLSSLTTNVLNLTKIENQTILTDVTCYNLSEQIRASILLMEDKWSKKQLDFNLDFGEHQIKANEELLKQVWINLIDNAIKFTEPGGMIEINISAGKSYTSVSIRNPGKEIPKESLKRIFNKFYQADESHSSEGNGIGLAIVKLVVELHHGIVAAYCENGYIIFTVTLPNEEE